jgi:hypothetical protein
VIWSPTPFFLIQHSALSTWKHTKQNKQQASKARESTAQRTQRASMASHKRSCKDKLGVWRNKDANLKCLVLIPLPAYFARNIRPRGFNLSHCNSLRVFIPSSESDFTAKPNVPVRRCNRMFFTGSWSKRSNLFRVKLVKTVPGQNGHIFSGSFCPLSFTPRSLITL